MLTSYLAYKDNINSTTYANESQLLPRMRMSLNSYHFCESQLLPLMPSEYQLLPLMPYESQLLPLMPHEFQLFPIISVNFEPCPLFK